MSEDEYGFDRLSTADFKRALSLNSSRINQSQRQMLRIHYGAPGRSVTASEMAEAMGWANHNAANLHYGRLGGFLCETFGKHPSQTPVCIVDFPASERAFGLLALAHAAAVGPSTGGAWLGGPR
ncbi:MAG TPA: hypothetical protein VN541_12900 [Tepidisphaeraceae bacterium]|nr:hypothetical protein [Tepidisphaeraceae bacterium]